jgi:hypothetical protein
MSNSPTNFPYPLICNRKGGYNVKTIINPSEPCFNTPTKGLYAWCYESQLSEIMSNGGIGKIKPGQYGTNTKNGTLPQNTINSYNWSAGEAVVILWVYPFDDEDFKVGTPYEIEQKILKELGTPIPDGNSQEIFITSVNQIEIALKTALQKNKLTRAYIPSEDNERAIFQMLSNENKYFGLFANMRHGKSFNYLEYIVRKYALNNLYHNHVVFCHDTKTYNGWKTKIERTYRGRIRCVELKNNKDYNFSNIPDMNTVVLVSPQLISAAVDNKDIPDYNAKIESLKNAYSIKAENVFVDEAHNYFTPQWENYYESILQDGQIILASGTYAILLQKHQDKFDESNTFIWGIDKLKQKLLKELNINLILKVKIVNPKDYTEEGLFNIANLQSIDDGILSNPYHFEQFFNKLLDKNSKFSPIFSHEKHHLILLDTVKAAQELKKIIKSKKYSDKIVPILVAGSKGRDANSEEELNKLISDADVRGLRTITITCGSMIQGVSERRWKNVLNMSSKSTYEIYWQLFGRTFEFDSVLDKHVGSTPKDVVVTMWDYNPHRIYSVGADFVDATAKVNGGNQDEALKTFHEIVDITEWINERRTWSKPKTLEELENKVYEIVNRHTIKRGLTINTCLHKAFNVNSLDSTWIEWAIRQEYKNNKNAKKIQEKLDIWQQSFGKQTTDHSISVRRTHVDLNQKQLINLQEQVKKVFENSLDKLDIVWAVYKSQGKVNSHIDELFKYYTDKIFLTGMGFPSAEISKIFVDTIKAHGLIDKINGKLKNSRIESIDTLLNLSKEEFLATTDILDRLYTYGGDDTQLSIRDAYNILREDDGFKNLRATPNYTSHVPYVKSGSINIALAYLLKEKSKKIFGKKLTNQEIIKMVTFEDENPFFESLNSAMGFTKSTSDKKDFIVINPPYSSGLHLDIFLKSFKDELNDYGTLICIHRETPVITKTPSPNKNTKEYRNIMLNNTSEITFFDGNKVFSTALFFAPLIISRVIKDSNKSHVKINLNHLQHPHSYEINDFNDVFIHTDIEKTIRIRKKLLDKMSSENLSTFNEMSTKKIKNSPYYVNIKQIGGHGMVNGKINKDFYCLVSPKFEYDLNNQITSDLNDCLTPAGRGGGIRANSYDEAVNIFEFMKTKVARFFISFTKIDQNIWDGDMLSILPYLDFTKKWDDESLFKYFELEDDLIEYINEYIEPIYEYEKSN